MSRISLVIAGAIAVAASAGVAPAAGGSTGGETIGGSNSKELSLPQATAVKKNVVYAMNAVSGSGQNGTVTLTPGKSGTTSVVIKLTGENASAVEPATIQTGLCGKPGPVKYSLTDVVKGFSNTIVSATTSALEAGTLSVHVNKSTAQRNVYVSCGNLK
jgi:hypothetical protein